VCVCVCVCLSRHLADLRPHLVLTLVLGPAPLLLPLDLTPIGWWGKLSSRVSRIMRCNKC
jgi:hypothetical protein